MSMNATETAESACATLRATVDLPEPLPPAMPMISGFIGILPTLARYVFSGDITRILRRAEVGVQRPVCHNHV
jgi:hypothetical protein